MFKRSPKNFSKNLGLTEEEIKQAILTGNGNAYLHNLKVGLTISKNKYYAYIDKELNINILSKKRKL
jgi:hypothetical protein